MTDEGTPREAASKTSFRLRDGVKILLIAFLVALCIRAFVMEGFRIPTESMERSLLVGDFVLVSKLHYGPRLPMSLGIPLTPWYLRDVALPYLRLPGVSTLRRGDAIVFNYPADTGPIDRRVHYIKRVVALPGDTVALRDKKLYVNSEHVPVEGEMQQRWIATTGPGRVLLSDTLRALGVSRVAGHDHRRNQVMFEATREVADRVAAWPAVVHVEPYVLGPGFGLRTFPPGSGFGRDHYGPLYVPARGDTVVLSEENWMTYRDLIIRYEHHNARLLPTGVPEIDGVRTAQYVVEQDYYFVLGDNRDSSVDSRVWGFVPVDHVVGKAVLVYFSLDAATRRPRLGRLFKRVR